MFDLTTLTPQIKPHISLVIEVKQEPPKQEYYTLPNDNLTKIAEVHQTSVERLWRANPQLSDPDTLTVNQALRIPSNEEVLPERPYPANVEVPSQNSTSARTPVTRGSSVGNTYVRGNCVWAVKNWVPWVQNGWGSAYQWVGRAKAQGFAITNSPRSGDVASAKNHNHVALVLSVEGGSVTIKEMNYSGLYQITTRTTPISEWTYIRP